MNPIKISQSDAYKMGYKIYDEKDDRAKLTYQKRKTNPQFIL